MTTPFINAKWPGLLVFGEPVTEDQAAEIIIRTTLWPVMSNNREKERQINNLLGLNKSYFMTDEIMEEYRILSLNYLRNDRVSSLWVGGLNGWCDWDGHIGCNTYNIGKWPNVDEVTDDLREISRAFPFLNMSVQTLSDGIGCGDELSLTSEWKVEDGEVKGPYFPTLRIQEYPRDTARIISLQDHIGPINRIKAGIELARKR
jgi:hypothetical protein